MIVDAAITTSDLNAFYMSTPVTIDATQPTVSNEATTYATEYVITGACSFEDTDFEITNNRKCLDQHFKWLAMYHTSMCRLRSGYGRRSYWHRIRSRCERPVLKTYNMQSVLANN